MNAVSGLRVLTVGIPFLIGSICVALPKNDFNPPPSPRLQVDLDPGWKFTEDDDSHMADPAFDDSSWRSVDLPHTWNARDGEDGGGDYRRGPGWYRRHLKLDPSLAGKRLYLQFDGASLMADVYVNGSRLGTHQGGFARFRFDATDALRAGQDNVIAVRVDNSNLGIPPISADFTFFGGLYRPVSLVATDQVQISTTNYGSSGVFLNQDKVTPERAEITVVSELENYEDKATEVDVETRISNPDGVMLQTFVTKRRIGAGDSLESRQSVAVTRPHLWNGRTDPYQYTVTVSLRTGKGRLRDAVSQPLGLRFFRVDPDEGFFLNGRHIDLHGVNRHQDRIDKGWAISEADEAEDFSLIHELACTAVRASHYEQTDSWYHRCDQSGIVVWAEIPFVNEARPNPEFLANAKQQLRELIRQNFNHPAICFWSVGNETRGDASDKVVAALAEVAHAEDPSRLSTYASDADDKDPKNWHTDVMAFNRYAGWYAGKFEDLPGILDGIHERHPKQAFGLSEFGAGASIAQHQVPPVQPKANHSPFHPEEYQALFHEQYWAALSARPYVWCKFVWCMFDFASDGRDEGDHPGRNDKGLVTYDRKTRKDAFYFYKANWTDDSVVHINSSRYNPRPPGPTEIKVYSNLPAIEVTLNGVSLGTVRSEDHIFRWEAVKLAPGTNRVTATGQSGEVMVSDACTWECRDPAKADIKP